MTPVPRARRSARRLIAVGAALLGVAAAAALALVLTGGSSSQQPARHQAPTRTGTPAAQPSPTAAAQFGVSVNRLFNDLSYTPAQIDAQLTALHDSGATIARTDAFWEGAEPAPPVNGVHHYDWRFDDTIAAALASHRLKWLPIIDYTAYWAESVPGKDHSPPTLPDDYAAYAAAFAARYGRSGRFWRAHPGIPPGPVDVYEIWNEPDGGAFWFPNPNAGQYADLYLRARDAIAAVQPAARVIVGGLSNPVAFLPAMLAARPDLRGHVDGVGIHPTRSIRRTVLPRAGRAPGPRRPRPDERPDLRSPSSAGPPAPSTGRSTREARPSGCCPGTSRGPWAGWGARTAGSGRSSSTRG